MKKKRRKKKSHFGFISSKTGLGQAKKEKKKIFFTGAGSARPKMEHSQKKLKKLKKSL